MEYSERGKVQGEMFKRAQFWEKVGEMEEGICGGTVQLRGGTGWGWERAVVGVGGGQEG